MTEILFAIPGDLEQPTGGYGYARRLSNELPAFGITVRHVELPGSFPSPSPEDCHSVRRLVEAAAPQTTWLIDGLAFGAFPEELAAAVPGRVIALVHHPLALESGLTPARRTTLHDSERRALAHADHVIATSPATKRILLADYGLSERAVTVAEPGTDPAHRSTGTGMPMQLLAVGTVTPRKAYDVLVDALAPLKSEDWRLTIAGDDQRNAEATVELRRLIAHHHLDEKITLSGVVVPATLDRFYESADIFVLPSLFEGYGMVLGEAMARGLPIICTTGGAAAETVPDEAAIKVPPGDAPALGRALANLMGDKKMRARLADAAWDAGRKLPTWNETARRIAAVVMGLHP